MAGSNIAAPAFAAALGEGADWAEAAKTCLHALDPVPGANLGFLYVTDALADHLSSITTLFRGVTGVDAWVGTVGIGICGTGREVADRPAVSAMIGRFPDGAVRLIPSLTDGMGPVDRHLGTWLAVNPPVLGLIHADPRNRRLEDMVPDLAERTGAYLVGGLSSSRSLFPQVAGRPAEDGVSGALFTGAVGVVTGLSQGCVPLGPPRQVTKAHGHTVMEIDGRRALDVLQADVMPVLAGSPGAMAGGLFIGLPIPGSDTGDYLVRDIVGADETTGAIQVRALVDPGAALLFCRRDRDSAAADMDRMLTTLSRRMKGPPQGGIYVGCLARGRHLFGREGAELAMIRERLGDFPLTGFFAAGEIANARFYTHTGVLTLFT